MKTKVIKHTSDPDYYNDVYLPLFDDTKRIKILYGGRDSGKSDFIAQKLLLDAINLPYFKCILIRRYGNTIKESQFETLKEIASYMGLDGYFRFLVSPLEIRCDNGNRFISRGCDDAAKLKSVKDPTHIWIEEADSITEDDYEIITLSLRNSKGIKTEEWLSFNAGAPNHWIVKDFFPLKDDEEVEELDASFEEKDGSHTWVQSTDPNATILHTSYKHNQFIADERIEKHARMREKKPGKYQIHSLGLFGVVVAGALWTWGSIKRVTSAPDLVRVCVGVDPSASNNKDSDECGIVAAGIDRRKNIYVLGDSSGILSPSEWAKRAVALYDENEGDFIVAEKNNGGLMIISVFENIGSPVKPKLVHASRGKRTRAEPIATLYDEGKVFHVGAFPNLENEMVTWDAAGGDLSPNRIDALVWAATFLTQPQRQMNTVSLQPTR